MGMLTRALQDGERMTRVVMVAFHLRAMPPTGTPKIEDRDMAFGWREHHAQGR